MVTRSKNSQITIKETQSKLSLFQQRIWFLEQLGPKQSGLNIVAIYELNSRLNLEQMQHNLDTIVSSVDSLRKVFVEDETSIAQRVKTQVLNYGIQVKDILGAECDPSCLSSLISKLEAHNFDVFTGPLFRVDIFSLSGDVHLLAITGHRLILDLNSLNWLAQQMLSSEMLPHDPVQRTSGYRDGSRGGFHHPDFAPKGDSIDLVVSKLDDASLVCELPNDFPRPAFQASRIQHIQVTLVKAARKALTNLAQRHSVSIPAVALSAYYALLYRYTMQKDILIGCLHHFAREAPLGIYENTAVIRQQIENHLFMSDLIKNIDLSYQSTVNDQRTPPFSLLIDALNPERDPSRSPIVQHGFAFLENLFFHNTNSIGVSRIYQSAPLIDLDLMLTYNRSHSDDYLTWHYDSSLFMEESITRFHHHYEQLLVSAAKDDELAVGQVVLTSPEEFEQITIQWNQTAREVDDFDFVYRLFEKQVDRTPDAVAVVEPGRQLCYRELNEQANQLSRLLVDYGVREDVIVAILEDRGINYLILLLAINKAGGAFLPLGATYPQNRIARVIEKSDSPLVIVGDKYVSLIQGAIDEIQDESMPKLINLSKALEESQDLSTDNLPARCQFHHLAYVMFTSGSTGEPKGVMVEHEGMINHNYGKIYDLEITKEDILAQTGRQTFDIMVWQFVAPLIVGGIVYVMPDEIALDPFRVLEEADAAGITILQLVPVNIEAILDVALVQGEERPKLTNLRWMVPTGDALYTDLCRRWLATYPHTRMLNTYGATECSDDQCHHVIASAPPTTYRPPIMTIGRPFINTQVYILDEWMQLVPIGVVGELYIGGVGVGRGYLKEPERTNSTFVHDPFSDRPGAKLYKSGDQARYLPDGTIEFLGRIGHMIKIRGFRVEPGEIQSVLNRHPDVAQSTVTSPELGVLGRQLVAYVVLRPDKKIDDGDLRDFVRQQVPDYMVPGFIVMLEKLPLNPNGKIDRKALPIPKVSAEKREIIGPEGEAEQKLIGIWKSLLKLESVSVRDNFFDLGGHSLLAMKLFSQIFAEFGKKLPLATIFRCPTIRDLATLLESEDTLETELKCVVSIRAGKSDRLPLFCIHAHGGHILMFYDLAKHLGDDLPVYGIQALGVDGNIRPLERFEEIAEAYIAEIKTVQPSGPYYLAGDCMGGTIGFEIARQLEMQGEKVELLLMFEAYCNGKMLKPGIPAWFFEVVYLSNLFYHRYLRSLFNLPLRDWPSFAAYIGERAVQSIKRRVLSRIIGNPYGADPLMTAQAALHTAEQNYQPTPINTTITLFNSRLPWGVVEDDTLGWSKYSTEKVRIHKFDYYDGIMLEDPISVQPIAHRLREILDKKMENDKT